MDLEPFGLGAWTAIVGACMAGWGRALGNGLVDFGCVGHCELEGVYGDGDGDEAATKRIPGPKLAGE